MLLKCYRNLEHCLMEASMFAVFKADNKYVTGLTPSGHAWLLPERVRLKDLNRWVPGLMRVSRSVLVSRQHVERVTGARDLRCVHALGQQYKLSRDEQPEAFQLAAIENIDNRPIIRWNEGFECLTTSIRQGRFAVIRFEGKQLIGVTTDCEVWRLPARIRLSSVLELSRGFMQINRSVVVARSQIEEVGGHRDDRFVRAFGKTYSLSRQVDPEAFRTAARENNEDAPRFQTCDWRAAGRSAAARVQIFSSPHA